MKCRRLDENGDYTFGNNQGNFISGIDAIAQCIRTKVMLFYNEWWENITIGIPMFQSILGNVSKESSNMAATLLLTQRILEIEEVKEVKEVKVEYKGRNVYFQIHVSTTEGELDLEVG